MDNELFSTTRIGDIIAAFSHDVEEKTGRPFSSFKWPNRLIYFHLINQRADIYYQTRKQNQKEGNYEDYNEVLPCVLMKEIDIVEACPCAPPSGCMFMKSVEPIPRFIGGRPTIVTTLTGFEKYDFVEWAYFKHRINNRISALNQTYLFTTYTLNNEQHLYTYITTDVKARNVKVAGVPIDPMEMALYPVCGKKPKNPCDILDLNFIIEKRLINILYDSTYKKLLAYNNGTRIGDTKGDDRNAEASPDPRY